MIRDLDVDVVGPSNCWSTGWNERSFLTDDTLCERGLLECSEAQVSDLDGGVGSGDEDVVTFEVSVQDWRRARVQEVKSLQDLKTPALQQLQLHLTEPAQVPARV